MPDIPLSGPVDLSAFTQDQLTYPRIALNKFEVEYQRFQWYLISDVTKYDEDENKGRDAAAAEVWNSVIWDMTETYSNSVAGRVRFWPGTVADPQAGPAKQRMAPSGTTSTDSNILDYLRQDELVHYEDLRGTFSRGPRPAEGPKKVTPSSPYYSNPYAYVTGITVEPNDHAPGYPRFRLGSYPLALNGGWFYLRFRHEYYWESGTLFPVDSKGVEVLAAFNYTKSRMLTPSSLAAARFDDGAWTGWKDDLLSYNITDAQYKLSVRNTNAQSINAFDSGYMPFAVGPTILTLGNARVTMDLLMSMVLVNERRESPV